MSYLDMMSIFNVSTQFISYTFYQVDVKQFNSHCTLLYGFDELFLDNLLYLSEANPRFVYNNIVRRASVRFRPTTTLHWLPSIGGGNYSRFYGLYRCIGLICCATVVFTSAAHIAAWNGSKKKQHE